MSNPALRLTLDEAIQEVLNSLTGLDLSYDPRYDRWRAIARMLNRALRANALEHEWSWYHDTLDAGAVTLDQIEVTLADDVRVRQTGDDAVRLIDDDGLPLVWAYFLPRDALHKYPGQPGLWCAVTRQKLRFSRKLPEALVGLHIEIPVMREPALFNVPANPEDPDDPLPVIDDTLRDQEVDFAYPDVIVARAAYMYSLTDPVMQPRAQTLEAGYKDLMYQAVERDDRNTDTPFQNEFFVPVQSSIYPESAYREHPVADRRGR